MSGLSGQSLQVLQRVAELGGVLLRVEQVPPPQRETGRAGALVLTFDVAKLLVAPAPRPESGEIAVRQLELPESPQGPLEDAGEQEPWWRVLGSPLSHVAAPKSAAEAVGAQLQFRHDADDPRRIALQREGATLCARLVAANAGRASRDS